MSGKTMWDSRSPHSYRAISVLLALLVSSVPFAHSGSDPPPPPEPIDSDSAALGISLKMTLFRPPLILFARLEEDEGIDDLDQETDLIPSTFTVRNHVYLLNVPPGTYVAVVAITFHELSQDEVDDLKTWQFLLYNPWVHRHYFSRQLIEGTKTTVGPRSFSFMGEFVAEYRKVKKAHREQRSGSSWESADEIQRHFMRMLEATERVNDFETLPVRI